LKLTWPCTAVFAFSLLASVRAVAQPPPATASPTPAPREGEPDRLAGMRLEHFKWSRDVGGDAPIRAIEVVNDYGDVRARLVKEATLEASGVIQRLDPGLAGVGVTVERRGAVVALTVAYPPGRLQDADADPRKDHMDRLDLTVFVPAGVAFGARTIRGIVEARGLESDVTAATSAGDISVTTSGAVQARTVEGQVRVLLRPGSAQGPIVLQSASGSLSLTVPAGADLDIRAETAGAISSDLPLKRNGRAGRTRLSGVVGDGRRDVLVYSETGGVEVIKAQP
jgi:hypothetical protein